MDLRVWDACWSELRARRTVAAVALCAFLPLWIFTGPVGLLVGFLALFGSYWWLRRWSCPRCRLPVVGVGLSSFPERCQACGLLLFGHPDDVTAPVGATTPNALRLSTRLRRFVAGAEIAAGAAVMLLTVFAGRLPFWYVITMEGLGGLSLAAGLWLWQGRERGYALSRAVLLMQLIRFESAWLVYSATAGFFVDLYHTARGFGVNPGFYASLGLGIAPGLPFGVAVNLWAAALLPHAHARTAGDWGRGARRAADRARAICGPGSLTAVEAGGASRVVVRPWKFLSRVAAGVGAW